MAEIKVKNGQAYCEKCGRNVAVREEKGDPRREQKPLILVDDQATSLGSATRLQGRGTALPDGKRVEDALTRCPRSAQTMKVNQGGEG